jgi:hypothetical protein
MSSSTWTSSPSVTWTVSLLAGGDTDVGAVETLLCFAGPPPARVRPENLAALPWLIDLPHKSDRRGGPGPALAVDDNGIITDQIGDDACVVFVVDVEAAARAINDVDVLGVVGRALVGSPDAWLWRPAPFVATDARLVVEERAESAGLSLAVPFARDDAGRFVVPPSTYRLQSFGALGRFEETVVQAPAHVPEAQRGRLRLVAVDVAGSGSGVDLATVRAWLEVAMGDVAVPAGRFPVDDVLVLWVPQAGRRPVIAGFLGRGGGNSAIFFAGKGPLVVDDDPELVDEEGRWVLTHELAHLWLPPVDRADGWLNEGLTTWHQEVLPAAAGRRPRATAQAQLEIGFRTGALRAEQDSLTVEESCRLMAARGSYQHCYWSGARLVSLVADALGDDAVFALAAALRAQGPSDAAPRRALDLLQAVASSSSSSSSSSSTSTSSAAQAAARLLMLLWEQQKAAPFPTVAQTEAS